MTLQPALGPQDPPSSRPRAGCLGGRVHRYEFDPAGGLLRLDLPNGAVEAAPGTVIDWAFYADGPAAVHAPWAALAVTVDVRFADGTRLSDDPQVRDRYDFALTADDQFAARWSMPEQWNANSVSLAPREGESGVVEVVLGSSSLRDHDLGLVSGVVEVVVREWVRPESPSPAEHVDTRRGTHSGDRFSRGNTLPLVAVPHGFTFITPATDASDSRWPYRPFVHDDPDGRRLEAVQFSHQPSPWMDDRGVVQLMPWGGRPVSTRDGRRRWMVDGTEVAAPHRWSSELDGGLAVQVTATSHAAAFRVVGVDDRAVVGFVIDQMEDTGQLRFTAPDRFEGWVPEAPEQGNQPRTFFAGRVLTPVTGHGHLDDAGHGNVAGFVAGVGAVEVRVAISYLSTEQARHSLALEAADDVSWDELAGRARDEWDKLLHRVVVPPLAPGEYAHRGLADEERRAILAHSLYRLHLYPNTSAENLATSEVPVWRFADPMVPAGVHTSQVTGAPVCDGDLVVNNGYWDTYRTVWSALALLDAPLTGRLVDGILEQYRRGGWMARWSAPGYEDCMVGTSSDQIFADAQRWGVGLDAGTALESGWRNACEPAPHPDRGRSGIGTARFTGFVSRDVHEGMSWSLENAISDAGLGRLAGRLAEQTDDPRLEAFARYFRNRSLAYRTLFDPGHGFFRGRLADGSFPDEDFDPRTWGGDNVETNGWGMSVTAVHDGAGLAALYGGPAGLRTHLDALFTEPETADQRFAGSYGTVIHEQREARAQRSGQCAISNQPAHHIPYMYAFTDQPWRAGATAHSLAARLFAGSMIAQGFPGDEDNGEMSAWWLWAALGLYPVELASGELLIGCPLLDDVEVHRDGGQRLRIRSTRSRQGARVLVGARLNGVALSRCWLPVDALQGDALLELTFAHEDENPVGMGSDLSAPRAHHPDLTGSRAGAIASDPGIAASALFDDEALAGVSLTPGQWVGWFFDEPVGVTDVTLTAAGPAAVGSLVWEVSVDGETFTTVRTTHDEALLPHRTTPFRLGATGLWQAVRVCAMSPVALSQIELFALDDVAAQ
ncbi:glycoside hydrolase domain-containing protein [Tessaracoccus antarcticus]|uniref:glycoside hydrolase domain-containing protein n=1 Tax=Tessaracoccus antarcticus TaxID=2479848 RepID=UPI0018F718CB|nr:glycoside hydrolase domain-containing protein [Tessaracoccus antarcticus]